MTIATPWHGWLRDESIRCDRQYNKRYDAWQHTLETGEVAEPSRIEFLYPGHPDHKVGIEAIKKCLRVIPTNPIDDHSERIPYFVDWLLWSLGHPRYEAEPPEPSYCSGASGRLAGVIDLEPLIKYPADYLGYLLTQDHHGRKWGKFYPTWQPCGSLMAAAAANAMVECSGKTLPMHGYEPCMGSGRLALEMSNYCRSLVGWELDPVLMAVATLNFMLYAPDFAFPIRSLGGDLVLGDSLVGSGESVARPRGPDSQYSQPPQYKDWRSPEVPEPVLPMISLANPPFCETRTSSIQAVEQYELAYQWKELDDGRFEKGNKLRSKVDKEALFLELLIRKSPPGSVVSVLLPNGILSSLGDQYIRTWLRERCNILASMQMPVNMWLQECDLTVVTSILLLQRKFPDFSPQDYSVLMGVAESCGFDRRGKPLYRRTPEGDPTDERDDDIGDLLNPLIETLQGNRGKLLPPAPEEIDPVELQVGDLIKLQIPASEKTAEYNGQEAWVIRFRRFIDDQSVDVLIDNGSQERITVSCDRSWLRFVEASPVHLGDIVKVDQGWPRNHISMVQDIDPKKQAVLLESHRGGWIPFDRVKILPPTPTEPLDKRSPLKQMGVKLKFSPVKDIAGQYRILMVDERFLEDRKQPGELAVIQKFAREGARGTDKGWELVQAQVTEGPIAAPSQDAVGLELLYRWSEYRNKMIQQSVEFGRQQAKEIRRGEATNGIDWPIRAWLQSSCEDVTRDLIVNQLLVMALHQPAVTLEDRGEQFQEIVNFYNETTFRQQNPIGLRFPSPNTLDLHQSHRTATLAFNPADRSWTVQQGKDAYLNPSLSQLGMTLLNWPQAAGNDPSDQRSPEERRMAGDRLPNSFQVGDIVKIVYLGGANPKWQDAEAEVMEVGRHTRIRIFSDPHQHHYFWNHEWLELVHRPEGSVEKPAVGQFPETEYPEQYLLALEQTVRLMLDPSLVPSTAKPDQWEQEQEELLEEAQLFALRHRILIDGSGDRWELDPQDRNFCKLLPLWEGDRVFITADMPDHGKTAVVDTVRWDGVVVLLETPEEEKGLRHKRRPSVLHGAITRCFEFKDVQPIPPETPMELPIETQDGIKASDRPYPQAFQKRQGIEKRRSILTRLLDSPVKSRYSNDFGEVLKNADLYTVEQSIRELQEGESGKNKIKILERRKKDLEAQQETIELQDGPWKGILRQDHEQGIHLTFVSPRGSMWMHHILDSEDCWEVADYFHARMAKEFSGEDLFVGSKDSDIKVMLHDHAPVLPKRLEVEPGDRVRLHKDFLPEDLTWHNGIGLRGEVGEYIVFTSPLADGAYLNKRGVIVEVEDSDNFVATFEGQVPGYPGDTFTIPIHRSSIDRRLRYKELTPDTVFDVILIHPLGIELSYEGAEFRVLSNAIAEVLPKEEVPEEAPMPVEEVETRADNSFSIFPNVESLCFLPLRKDDKSGWEASTGIELSIGDTVICNDYVLDLKEFNGQAGILKAFLQAEEGFTPWFVLVDFDGTEVVCSVGMLEPASYQGLRRGDRAEIIKCNYPDYIGEHVRVNRIDWCFGTIWVSRGNGLSSCFPREALQPVHHLKRTPEDPPLCGDRPDAPYYLTNQLSKLAFETLAHNICPECQALNATPDEATASEAPAPQESDRPDYLEPYQREFPVGQVVWLLDSLNPAFVWRNGVVQEVKGEGINRRVLVNLGEALGTHKCNPADLVPEGEIIGRYTYRSPNGESTVTAHSAGEQHLFFEFQGGLIDPEHYPAGYATVYAWVEDQKEPIKDFIKATGGKLVQDFIDAMEAEHKRVHKAIIAAIELYESPAPMKIAQSLYYFDETGESIAQELLGDYPEHPLIRFTDEFKVLVIRAIVHAALIVAGVADIKETIFLVAPEPSSTLDAPAEPCKVKPGDRVRVLAVKDHQPESLIGMVGVVEKVLSNRWDRILVRFNFPDKGAAPIRMFPTAGYLELVQEEIAPVAEKVADQPTVMKEIQQGDRVRVLAVQQHQSQAWIGRVGTVEKITKGKSGRIHVRLDAANGEPEPFTLPFPKDGCLELVQEETIAPVVEVGSEPMTVEVGVATITMNPVPGVLVSLTDQQGRWEHNIRRVLLACQTSHHPLYWQNEKVRISQISLPGQILKVLIINHDHDGPLANQDAVLAGTWKWVEPSELQIDATTLGAIQWNEVKLYSQVEICHEAQQDFPDLFGHTWELIQSGIGDAEVPTAVIVKPGQQEGDDYEVPLWAIRGISYVPAENVEPPVEPEQPKPKLSPKTLKKIQKFREGAAQLEREIQHRRNPSAASGRITRKRCEEAIDQLQQAQKLTRHWQALNAIANALESGTCPPELEHLNAKVHVTELVDNFKRGAALPNAFGDDRDRFDKARELLLALPMPDPIVTDDEIKLKSLEWQLCLNPIPGFFPTTKPLATRMIELADIRPGHRVSEPQAGNGAIADLLAQIPGIDLSVYEAHPGLAELLRLKGHSYQGEDFLACTEKFNRIVENPPFENLQDIEHVRHSYECLDPDDGRLVAIMSTRPFWLGKAKDDDPAARPRKDERKCIEFRQWFKEVGGIHIELPKGSFNQSQRSTGVDTCMVVIGIGAGRPNDVPEPVPSEETPEERIDVAAVWREIQADEVEHRETRQQMNQMLESLGYLKSDEPKEEPQSVADIIRDLQVRSGRMIQGLDQLANLVDGSSDPIDGEAIATPDQSETVLEDKKTTESVTILTLEGDVEIGTVSSTSEFMELLQSNGLNVDEVWGQPMDRYQELERSASALAKVPGTQVESFRTDVVVHVNHAPYDQYIGRASGRHQLRRSKWHNLFKVGRDGDLPTVLGKFEEHLIHNDELMGALEELRGKRLACWCCDGNEELTADDPLKCHGQILLKALRGDYAEPAKPFDPDGLLKEVLLGLLPGEKWDLIRSRGVSDRHLNGLMKRLLENNRVGEGWFVSIQGLWVGDDADYQDVFFGDAFMNAIRRVMELPDAVGSVEQPQVGDRVQVLFFYTPSYIGAIGTVTRLEAASVWVEFDGDLKAASFGSADVQILDRAAPEHSKLPEKVLAATKAAIAAIKKANEMLEIGRNLDQRHGGDGRYEADTWRLHGSRVESALEKLDQYRSHAPEHGVDFDKVLAELEYVAPLEITSAAQEWLKSGHGSPESEPQSRPVETPAEHEANPLLEHGCHAEGCDTPVDATLLMCTKHWRMVPLALQQKVWRHYRAGQEQDKQPSAEYLEAAKNAIAAVKQAEEAKRAAKVKPEPAEVQMVLF
jgi:hypothetical protein